jgi:hypothetical protein
MHKAKRNNNLTFSKGKTWQLEDVRALEVIGVSPSKRPTRGRGKRLIGANVFSRWTLH